MANVVSRIEEALSLFQRATDLFNGVRDDLNDGREAVNERNLGKLQEMLRREELETKAARDDLAAAIAEYRKRRA